ncbi:unnamed protein product [Thlaspi arvense]|uniref:Polygalacturonase n=1 Tax=Thlaspi arvense TaxID=13288 RepID=A0AAU9S4B7_THLAR|nr:unnamed protein product [Thlaspi arvense]
MTSPLVLFVFLFISSCSAQSYNVLSFGAKPDGKTDATKAFMAVWETACASPRPVTIVVPKGRFLLRSLNFDGSKCKPKQVTFRIDGTLVAPADYRVIGNEDYWIFFNLLDGVTVYGGVLDAQGASLWDCKKSGKTCPSGATVSNVFKFYH